MDPTLAIVSVSLTAIGLGATFLATILTRKGKREDQKLSERQTAYEELYQLNEARGAEIVRLNAAILAIRDEWEARWDRQMVRCRTITEPLVRTIVKLQAARPFPDPEAAEALTELEHHNEDDHGGREERP